MNEDLWVGLLGLVFYLGVPLALITIGYFAGRRAEQQHYLSLHQREARFVHLPAITGRTWDLDRSVADATLVAGSVVVSADYFKRLLGTLRNIVGGRLRSYESLLDRARREAILRLKEQCPDADIIVNLRMETSTISSRNRQGGVACIELIAYGTAIRYQP